MTASVTVAESAAAFAACREVVPDDHHVVMRLRRPVDPSAFVARAIAGDAARGFAFDEAAVLAASRDGEAEER